MGYATREVVWTANAVAMLDEAIATFAVISAPARDGFVYDVLRAGDQLVTSADDGGLVPELSSWQIREIFVGHYRVQYHLTPDRAEILAVCPRR